MEISSRIGERHSLCATGLGKALLLDEPASAWQARFYAERLHLDSRSIDFGVWQSRMVGYVEAGCAFDLEENEDMVRCVAAPVRDETGRIVAAISVSSAAHYMEDARMAALRETVRGSALGISRELGFAAPDAV
jgi:DNA-binding IclR family transcriptional regulator